MYTDNAIEKLCKTVEKALDREMRTPKDFSFLADSIFEKMHETVSPTTLKRMWGYLSEPVTPRLSTLDILSQFVGYSSWKDFCMTEMPEMMAEQNEVGRQAQRAGKQEGHAVKMKYLFLALALILVVAGSLIYGTYRSQTPSYYVLKKGQKFKTYHDYLKLFGITDTVRYWGKVHPKYHYISLWGPEYQNKYWHNFGDPKQMMPTITERWEPAGEDQRLVTIRNRDNYNHERRVNEVRITFMKNLVDSGFVFLGVYRMAIDQSDTTHCVWERVLDECDLNQLDYLETLRN